MKVFLSYSKEDCKLARALASQLKKIGLEPWDPNEVLFPGDNWASEIGKALEKSEAMVVLVSPSSMKSDQVLREVDFALGSPRYKGRLIPVVLAEAEEMPWIFKNLRTVRLSTDLKKSAREIAEHINP